MRFSFPNWLKNLGESISDTISSYSSSEPLKKTSDYKKYLSEEEEAVSSRIRENSCPKATLRNFKLRGFLAEGGFGIVLTAFTLPKREPCVIKIITKALCVENETAKAVVQEKKIQYALRSEFTVKLLFAFQDAVDLYMVMEYALYGDFMKHCFRQSNFFNEEDVRFIAAQIVLALEYMHTCHILHRDVKPDNVFAFADGYVKLGDFGCAKWVLKETSSFCGTTPFIAPEVIRNKPYGTGVDWWSFGVLIYILIYDDYPFVMDEANELQNYKNILFDDPEFPRDRRPSDEAIDFITRLLERNVTQRLGVHGNGCEDVKAHPWFRSIDFLDVFHKRIPNSFKLKPVVGSPLTAKDIPSDLSQRAKRKDPFKKFFEGF